MTVCCHILVFHSSYNSDLTSGLADPWKIVNYGLGTVMWDYIIMHSHIYPDAY